STVLVITMISPLSLHDALPISRNFGFGINSDEFERLALSLPLNIIQKHGDSLFQIEALMFGQAGMLENCSNNDDFDDYYLELKRSEEHTSELQSRENLVCRLLL